MRTGGLTPMGGDGEVVEIDETLFGKVEGAPKHIGHGQHHAWRNTVMTLVTRGGSARSFHIESHSIAQMLPIIRANIKTETAVMTDEGTWYNPLAGIFASHDTVKHASDEYVRYGQPHVIHTNTVEGYYSIFKRGMKGIYQHCSEKHLHRYLAEFDFRYSYRVRLGYSDEMRAAIAIKCAANKRLTYRQPRISSIPL